MFFDADNINFMLRGIIDKFLKSFGFRHCSDVQRAESSLRNNRGTLKLHFPLSGEARPPGFRGLPSFETGFK